MKAFLALAAFAVLFASCSDPIPTQPQVPFSFWVSPQYSIVETGSTVQLYSSSAGTTDHAATWTMLTPGDSIGTLSAAGLYTAPLKILSDSLILQVQVRHNATGSLDTAIISLRPGPERLLVRATVGTVYSYAYYMTDSTGKIDPTTETTKVDEVISILNNEQGKDSVFHMKDERPNERLYRIDPTLDIQAFDYGKAVGQWLRMPFSNLGGPAVITLKDETVGGVRTLETVIATYIGNEVMMFKNVRYFVNKVRVRTLESVSGGAGAENTIDEIYYFAASLGWFIRIDRITKYDDADEHRQFSERWTLQNVIPG
ncbi:MAG: hypothetical protein H7X80_08510 [bacterium]|nr:hypothetical protein [Candidatus Kapabacteria bacterium]